MASFNKGDVSEGILAAAIGCRFLSKTDNVTSNDVLAFIKKLKDPIKVGGALVSTTEFESPNSNSKIKDTLKVIIGLAPANMEAFLDSSIYSQKDVKELLVASIAYANGSHIKDAAELLYNNNQRNEIVISSEGLLDQTGTKVDLKITVDGEQLGVGISLKAGDVKQFGQVGGATVSAMDSMFNPLGVTFTSKNKSDFTNLVAEKDVPAALSLMYSIAAKQIKSSLTRDQSAFKKNLSDFVVFHATRNEPDVALVQLKKNEASSYNFSNLKDKLTGHELTVDYSEGSTDVIPGKKIPKIIIGVKHGKPGKNSLIEIRAKLEGNRVNSKGKQVGLTVRNLVEKGHMSTELLAEKYK